MKNCFKNVDNWNFEIKLGFLFKILILPKNMFCQKIIILTFFFFFSPSFFLHSFLLLHFFCFASFFACAFFFLLFFPPPTPDVSWFASEVLFLGCVISSSFAHSFLALGAIALWLFCCLLCSQLLQLSLQCCYRYYFSLCFYRLWLSFSL